MPIRTFMIKFMLCARIGLVPECEIQRKPNCICGIIDIRQISSQTSGLAHSILLMVLFC